MCQNTVPKKQYDALVQHCRTLEAENRQLLEILKAHHIAVQTVLKTVEEECTTGSVPDHPQLPSVCFKTVSKFSSSSEKIHLFMSLFHGRDDVFALYWESKRSGKKGYSPACKNSWIPGVCPLPQKKCHQCTERDLIPYTSEAAEKHLSPQYRDVIGIYAIRPDDTCLFLAMDLDEENWPEDVKAIRSVCRTYSIPCSVEKSRSGNGAHIWFFFSEPIPAAAARRMGSSILSAAMKTEARLSFASYDRMFPNQDTMPSGGFGSLISLPLQPDAARTCGGSLFIDENGQAYPDQWTYLSGTERMDLKNIEAAIAQIGLYPLGELLPENEEEKPWLRPHPNRLPPDDTTGLIKCVLADRIYISTNGVSQAAQNSLKRLAAFRNPEFYQKQAIRMPVSNTPRVICCAEYDSHFLCLPRGCAEAVNEWALFNGVATEWLDEQCIGKTIPVSFRGTLYTEQQIAFSILKSFDKGVLSATTAFGKTVIAASLIADKKTNTLILVHRKQLLDQWKERLEQFLDIQVHLPAPENHRGRKKQYSAIGQYGAGKDTLSGIIDIAMMQSIDKKDELPAWISEYGLVIVDECHHVPAVSFEGILKKIRAKYTYGLTATPKRKDGHHPIIPMYLGPIRYRVNAREQAARRPFDHLMIPRFTGTEFPSEKEGEFFGITEYYKRIAEDDLRSHLIAADVLSCIKEGRNCLVLSERVAHVQNLAELIRKGSGDENGPEVFLLTGGTTRGESSRILRQIRTFPADKPLVICATGKYIGEGFDESRLDTLFLTMPVSWEGILAQYAGRLHRLYNGKTEVRVYDYIDNQAVMLERMYTKRLRTYQALGYRVCSGHSDTQISTDIIFDRQSFIQPFLQDIRNAKKSIRIVSPFVKEERVEWLLSAMQGGSPPSELTVVTRPCDAFRGKSSSDAFQAIRHLRECGANVLCKNAIHQKFAVIDEKIVWYGSINLLSFGSSQESIIRIISRSVARTLMRSTGITDTKKGCGRS